MESYKSTAYITPPTSSPLDQTPEAMEADGSGTIDSHESGNITPDEDHGRTYGLRGHTRLVPSTWLDKDETGNYDPSEERRKEQLKRNRTRLRAQRPTVLRNRCLQDREEGNEAADERSPPKVIHRVIVQLKFQNEDQTKAFRQLASSLCAKNEAKNGDPSCRKRTRAAAFQYDDNYETSKARKLSDLPSDLTGHPKARGCWGCIEVGEDCSLLSDEHSWPCKICDEDDNDCHLVVPPTIKRACNRCRRRRNPCSYTYTLNHGEACQQCCDEGFRCVAGPAKETVRTRIRFDRDWVDNPLPIQKARKLKSAIVECKECNAGERTCSLRETGKDGGACTACVATGERCTLEKLMPFQGTSPSSRSKKEEVEDAASTSLPDYPCAKSAKEDSEGPAKALPPLLLMGNGTQEAVGLTKTADTKFCHPIEFNYEGNKICHFCDEPGFSFFALEEKEVEVIEWTDGRGLEEVDGGHRADGLENTRMCLRCTFSRIPIIMCPFHDLRPIKGVKATALDLNSAFDSLFAGKLTNQRWCDICVNLAQYECCTPSVDGDGCGLGLCERCMVMLSGRHDGDLQRMLETPEVEQSDENSTDLRADSEFLKKDGLLMRYVMWSTEQQQ